MKKFICIIGLLAFGLAASQAQSIDRYAAQSLGIPGNILAGASSTNLAVTADVRYQGSVELAFSYVSSATNVYTNLLVYVRSVDGVNYETATNSLNFVNNGTNPVVWLTNISTAGYGYMKFTYLNNPNGGAYLTNMSLLYSFKTRDQ